MGIKLTNNAFGTLAAGINSSATSITLTSGQGARFPTLGVGDYFYATLIDTSNNLEIVKCTARSTDVLTVTRAQENTTARSYSTGDRIEIRITAATFEEASGIADGEITEAKLASGAVTAAKMASGAAVGNLGYTPVNKAGDTMTGTLNITGGDLDIDGRDGLQLWTAETSGNKYAITGALRSVDIRSPKPNEFLRGAVIPFFSSRNLDNGGDYIDALHFATYTDSSGGDPNVLGIAKSTSEVRIARGTWASSSVLGSTKFASGTIYTLNYTSASDASVKENVQPITDGLNVILALRPVTFEWTDEYIRNGMSLNETENNIDEQGNIIVPEQKQTNVGLIAQEVAAVLPTVTHQDNVKLSGHENFLLNVSYEKIVPHLIAAVKEQQAQIETLKAEVAALKAGA
jgi:hypothetical protein